MRKASRVVVGGAGHKETSVVAEVAEERGAEVGAVGRMGTRPKDLETLLRKCPSNGKPRH